MLFGHVEKEAVSPAQEVRSDFSGKRNWVRSQKQELWFDVSQKEDRVSSMYESNGKQKLTGIQTDYEY